MLRQITVFAENKKGTFQKITQILADNDISIDSCITNDGTEYGTIRMLSPEPETVKDLLSGRDYMCRLTNVIGVVCDHGLGGLNDLMIALKDININVDYVYTAHIASTGQDIIVVHTEDIDIIENSLKSRGFEVL